MKAAAYSGGLSKIKLFFFQHARRNCAGSVAVVLQIVEGDRSQTITVLNARIWLLLSHTFRHFSLSSLRKPKKI